MEIGMCVVWILLYGILYSISDWVQLELSCVIYIIALLFYLWKSGKLKQYGITMFRITKYGYFMIPMMLLPIVNLCNQQEVVAFWQVESVLILLQVFFEELLFRGYLLQIWGVVWANVMFAAFHLINLFQGVSVTYTIIQMICAFGIGLCLSMFRKQLNSIFPGVVIHYLINLTSYPHEWGTSEKIVYSLIGIGYCIYALGLFFYDKKKSAIRVEETK